jgi:type IV pilus assembly protein PilM
MRAGIHPGMLTGIDIGSTAIRVVETSRSKDEASVANFGQLPLPADAVRGGLIADPSAVTDALKQMWATHKFKNKQVVVGVTSAQILVREMSVPNLPDRELKQALPFQVRELLPMPVDKALLDFYPLADPGKSPTIRGLVVAAPKENVLTTVRAVERAGLRVARVDLASFAILRSAAVLAAPVEAIVDLGAHASTIVVHADGRPLIVRTVPRGGGDITDVIAERLTVPVADAEALKCRFGLHEFAAHQPGQSAVAGQDANVGRVAGIVAEAIRPLIGEIRSSIAYVKSADAQARVANLGLTGGGAMLPGLPDLLHRELGIDVFLADPLRRLNESRRRGKHNELARFRSSAAISLGLTLGAA